MPAISVLTPIAVSIALRPTLHIGYTSCRPPQISYSGPMIRYGFACKTVGVPQADLTAITLARATHENMRNVCRHNLRALETMLRYCAEAHIPLMRISSDIIPLASHPQNSFDWQRELHEELASVRATLAQTGIRVSMHPGQYTVLNSPRQDVVDRAVDDLTFHADFLDALGADGSARIILHLGGGYGDRASALDRLTDNLLALPPQVLGRVSLENDERVFNIEDALAVCGKCGLPAIFDVFHHSLNAPAFGTQAYWIDRAMESWCPHHGRPKLHYSQQLAGGKPGMHSRSIGMKDFLEFHRALEAREVDVMLEVKDKNLSAVKCINLASASVSRHELTREWARYKYLILERDQAAYNAFRAMLKADAPNAHEFYSLVEHTLEKEIYGPQARNAAEHVWGYMDKLATPAEKKRVLAAMGELQNGPQSLPRAKRALLGLAQKHNVEYLLQSLYFYI